MFQGQYSLARAQQSFKSLVQIHEKNGKNPLFYQFLLYSRVFYVKRFLYDYPNQYSLGLIEIANISASLGCNPRLADIISVGPKAVKGFKTLSNQ